MPGRKRDLVNTDILTIKISPDLKKKLIYIAKEKYKWTTLTGYVRDLLENEVKFYELIHGSITEEELKSIKKHSHTA